MGQHALLAPSSAERWIACPASVRLSADAPREPESHYAAEGTAAHALCELKASLAFGIITGRTFAGRHRKWKEALSYDAFVHAEMEDHTDAYVELIRERMARHPNTVVMLEQRLNTGIPNSWGTSDTVLVSEKHVEIIDFKYGQGVRVEAQDNPQLRLYALGALDTYGDLLGDVENVYMTVHQPRLGHTDTEVLTADELRAWRTMILPIAAEALAGSTRFGPSETACRWCPVAGTCRARVEAATAVDFALVPELVSPDELAELLTRIPMIRGWCNDVEAHALDAVYSKSEHIPGWKVVMSGGIRSIKDKPAAVAALRGMGYGDDVTHNPGKLKGLGDLEKLVGKQVFLESIERPFVTKGEGSPSLVPETDYRTSTNPDEQAKKEFE